MQLVSSKFKILHPIWTSISRLLMKLLVLAYFGLLGNRAGTTVCVCVCVVNGEQTASAFRPDSAIPLV